jgi:histidinol phosphatase-like PHP family hydrolase
MSFLNLVRRQDLKIIFGSFAHFLPKLIDQKVSRVQQYFLQNLSKWFSLQNQL